jgi:hypothetical protein
VRARCAAGWAIGEEAARADGRGDAELVVHAKAGVHGFVARSRAGADIAVVYEAPVAKLLPATVEGHVIRVLDGIWRQGRSELELKAWTEVFIVNDAA